MMLDVWGFQRDAQGALQRAAADDSARFSPLAAQYRWKGRDPSQEQLRPACR